MGVRSDVAFVILKEDFEALERAFEKYFPESKLLDCFKFLGMVEEKGETWFVFIRRKIKWHTDDLDIPFLMSYLRDKRTQFAEACETGYSESWNSTPLADLVYVANRPELMLDV